MDSPLLLPDDEFNRRLVSCVHPPDWINPPPADRYDLVVIGAGTAGLVAAAGAAGVGARVALIERHLLGGDCLNYGCVPSKALLSAARLVAASRRVTEQGVLTTTSADVNFPAVMQRMRRLRAEISRHDSAERFRDMGVDIFLGAAEFTSAGNAVQVGDAQLRFRKAVICTGARAAVPLIPGLHDADYLTNESLFSVTELPRRLAVIGGGPVGCEMAQAFARFGSEVLLFERSDRILSRDEATAAECVAASLAADGVQLHPRTQVLRVDSDGVDKRLEVTHDGQPASHKVDAILVAVGRAPNVEGLQLEAAGVEYNSNGVTVDDFLRTTNRRIYAAGDICFPARFTHAADYLARTVVRNALFFGRGRASQLLIPRCTYTSPELAQVGLTQVDAQRQGIRIDTFVQPMTEVDRAVLDGAADGFVQVHVRRGTDHIVGATIVAPLAGDLISELTLAMQYGLGLRQIGATIHPYPTQADAIRKLGDQFNRTRLTPFTRWLLKTVLSFA
ncbi:MAG: mercuric reductase [Planctomycetaceae bacterium]